MPYDLIIFDCDGTLVDTEYSNNLAMVQTLHSYGLSAYTVEYALDHFTGLKFGQILEDVASETGFTFPEDAAKQYVTRARILAESETKQIDHVHDALRAAKSYAEICVVSNGERNNVLASLEQEGLREYFDDEFIFTGLMAPNPKPAPDLFLLAAHKKRIKPSRILVIEDSVAGVTAAKRAHMDSWGFVGTHHNPANHAETLKQVGSNMVFTKMLDIKSEFDRIFETKDLMK